MAKTKTKETNVSVEAFISKIDDEIKRDDSYRLIKLFEEASGFKAKMWGPSIIGFGSYHYKYESGHEGDMCMVGFSPRKSAIVLYVMNASEERGALLEKLGKHKTGKGCIYIKKFDDVNPAVISKMIKLSIKSLKKQYPDS